MKRILSTILSLALTLPAMLAAEWISPDGLKYYLNTTTKQARLDGVSDESFVEDLVVPATVTYNGDEYKVIEIANNAFYGNLDLRSVKFGANVLRVGTAAFYQCYNLGSVIFNRDCHTIAAQAFYACRMLEKPDLPADVSVIGDYAFWQCDNMFGAISIPASTLTIGFNPWGNSKNISTFVAEGTNNHFKVIDDVLFGNNGRTLICYPIDRRVNGNKPSSYTVPESVTVIGANSMRNNPVLEEVIFNDNLVEIESGAFNVDNLKKVHIPASVTTIGDRVFASNRNITEFTVDPANKNYQALNGMLCSRDGHLICGIGAEEVVVPDEIQHIDGYAFYNIFAIKKIDLGSATSVGRAAFYNCPQLSSVDFGDALQAIGVQAFYRCTALSEVSLPSSMRTIETVAFAQCIQMEKLKLPEGLETIGDGAFQTCSMLKEANIPGSVTQIGNSVFFMDESLEKVTFGEGATSTGISTFYGCYSLHDLTLPSTMLVIPQSSFNGCTGLSEISFNEGLKTIGQAAFQKSGIQEVVLPNSLETIETSGFSYMYALTKFTAGTGLKSIGDGGIGANSELTEINLNEGLQSIGSQAFAQNSSLSSIAIPSTVEHLGDYIFVDTPSLLTFENRAKTPQRVGFNFFRDDYPYEWVTLRVPEESIGLYKAAEFWRKFNNIEGFDETGIADTTVEAPTIVEIYDINGRRRSSLEEGVNIVRMSDGSVSKVIR